jgi:DNA-binding winged helix-turn-helix (wHTH) protein
VNPAASLMLDPGARRISVDGRELELTSVEYDILASLASAAGTIVSRDEMVLRVFSREANPEDRSLDVHISRLRRKLGPHANLIVTIRGVGHMFRAAGSNTRSVPLAASLLCLLSLFAAPAFAQEDIEPRTVGGAGVTTIGVAGFIDRFESAEDTFPLHTTLQVDVSRFVTGRLAVRAGLIGSAVFGTDADEEVATGPGAAALDARGALLFYFTPQSMVSAYAGAEYRTPLTARADEESGTALGVGGVQAMLSARASIFVQGGYGARLTRGSEGERQTRIVGETGIRIRF